MVSNMRVWRQLLALGFRASPRWMAAGLAVAVIGALSLSCYAIGFQQLVDGYLQHDPRRVVGGAIITALLFSVGWTTGVLGANINFGLTERVGMYVTERLAEAVLGVPGI